MFTACCTPLQMALMCICSMALLYIHQLPVFILCCFPCKHIFSVQYAFGAAYLTHVYHFNTAILSQ